MKKFRLKSEMFWVKKEEGIEFFFNNKEINKLINTEKNDEFFSFLQYLELGRENKEIIQYPYLTSTEKQEIIHFLEKNKYGVWESSHNHTRTEYFINTYPETNFIDYQEKINNSNILIIGLGTASSYCLEILTKLGYKNFTLIDGDLVEKKNLTAQCYDYHCVGKYKVNALSEKYSHIANISTFSKYVDSFDDLLNLVHDINNFDFIINGADHLPLIKELLNAKLSNNFLGILIDAGYGILTQNATMIDNSQTAQLFLDKIDSTKFNSKQWIVSNSGSIFNAIFCSFSISKMIFDNTIEINNSKIAYSDFLQNRYFIGSKIDHLFFEEYSTLIKNNMEYKHIPMNNNNWLTEITNTNIFSIIPNFEISSLFSFYEREFLFKNEFNDYINTVEFKASQIIVDSTSMNCKEESILISLFLKFTKKKFGEEIYNRVNTVIKHFVIDTQNKNIKKQNKAISINNNWAVFNTSYNNDFDRIIGKIHELFHIIFWEITSNEYEHERFVMEFELKFYYEIKTHSAKLNEFFAYYLKYQMSLFTKNYLVLCYEKSVINKTPNIFKVQFKDITDNRVDDLIYILNSQINFQKPLYLLKYLLAFEKNQHSIELHVNNIIDTDVKV